MNRLSSSICSITAIFILSAAIPVVCLAANWNITPRFAISELYSDNIILNPTEEQEDFVTQATPGLSIRGNGARVDVNMDYNLQTLTYVNDSSRNSTNHQLQSNVNMEVLRNKFFVNVAANVFQALVSSNGAITNDNIRRSNNREDVITISIQPEFRHHFGNWADLTAGTQFSEVMLDQDRSGAGRGQNFNVNLRSGSRFSRFRWGIRYSQRNNNNSNGSSSSSFGRLTFNGSYILNRMLSLDGSVGNENNNFNTQRGSDGSSLNWSLGATLTPSRRTSLSGSVGERAFGSTKRFSFNHRHRRISISANYNEELRTSQEELLNQQLIPLEDAFGEPVFEPDEISNLVLPINTLSLVDEVFVTRNFSANIGYLRRRDTFNVQVFRFEREGQGTQSDEKSIGFTSTWNRTVNRRLSGGLRLTFRSGNSNQFARNQSTRQQFVSSNIGSINPFQVNQNQNADSDVYFVTPFVSYTLGPSVSTNFSYTYTKSSSDNLANNYTENSVSGALNFAF